MTPIPFNALSESQRQRLAECFRGEGVPSPIGAQHHGLVGALFLPVSGILFGVGGLVVSSWWGFGEPTSEDLLQGPFWLVLYLVFAAIAVYSMLATWRELDLRRRLPWTPGTFLFATDLIDASTEELRIFPMSQLVDFGGVHQHTNGVYQHTAFTFHFEGGSHNMTVYSKDVAEQILSDLREQHTMLQAAVAMAHEDDGARSLLFSLDPLIEARLSESRPLDQIYDAPVPVPSQGVSVSRANGLLRRAVAVALVLAVPLGLSSWGVRNVASDLAGAAEAEASSHRGWGTWEVRGYVENGFFKTDEARTVWLPRAQYEEATQDGSATALRRYLDEFPDSVHAPQARERLAALYDKTLAAFENEATDDPRIVPFMTALVQWLETHEKSEVAVRFDHPDSEMLTELDSEVQKTGGAFEGIPVAPIAPSFSQSANRFRQSNITRALNEGFRKVFPADILTLVEGPELDDTEAEPPTLPTVSVTYTVGPSGAVYTGDDEARLFVGISVPFVVLMEVPGHDDVLEFFILVEPPERFTTYSESDRSIYDVMARLAFEQLATKLKGAFFKGAAGSVDDVGSDILRQLEEALQGAPPL